MRFRSFLSNLVVVLALFVGVVACDNPTAPEPSYEQIGVQSVLLKVMEVEAGGPQRGNRIYLCLPRSVDVVAVEAFHTSKVSVPSWSYGLNGSICNDGRDMYSTGVAVAGLAEGEGTVTMNFEFSRGNPLKVTFKVKITPSQKG